MIRLFIVGFIVGLLIGLGWGYMSRRSEVGLQQLNPECPPWITDHSDVRCK